MQYTHNLVMNEKVNGIIFCSYRFSPVNNVVSFNIYNV